MNFLYIQSDLYEQWCILVKINFSIFSNSLQRNWVFHTNNVLIPKSLQPNVVDLRYFKLLVLLYQIVNVWKIKGLQDHVAKIYIGIGKLKFVAKIQLIYKLRMSIKFYIHIQNVSLQKVLNKRTSVLGKVLFILASKLSIAIFRSNWRNKSLFPGALQ